MEFHWKRVKKILAMLVHNTTFTKSKKFKGVQQPSKKSRIMGIMTSSLFSISFIENF
jgi:hypothetical protein